MQQQQPPSKSEIRNLIIAGVLSLLVLTLWGPLFGPDEVPPEQTNVEQSGAAGAAGGDAASNDAGPAVLPHDQALARADRIAIRTPSMEGSISLEGGVIDELRLTGYDTELNSGEPIELLHPQRTANAYFAWFGWRIGDTTIRRPGKYTVWEPALGSAATLTPQTPVVLEWTSPDCLVFSIKYMVDDRYMFTTEQTIRFLGEDERVATDGREIECGARPAVNLAAFTRVERHGRDLPASLWILHAGPIGSINGALVTHDYDDLDEADQLYARTANGGAWYGEQEQAEQIGWIGFTDPYWLTAVSPADRGNYRTIFARSDDNAGPYYIAETVTDARLLEQGGETTFRTRFFAGAKEISTLRDYQYELDGAEEPQDFLGKVSNFFFYSSDSRFVDSVDWGWFFFLTKPIFEILTGIYGLVGNMGVSIILLTILVKMLLFPLAHKSYVSMSKMKKLQPDLKKLQERHKDDRQKLQQEMMALYKREKVNPAAGCLPLLLQIPIFFSLYKVLNVSIELRHAPFFGWIQDLTAPDPTSILNLFGLLPYDVPDLGFLNFLSIGVWPILMGITMWLQQSLNPAPTDAAQAKIFAWLPIIFTFMLAHFAAGLVIYWTANNTFTIIQQYTIMRRQGVEVNFIENVKRKLGFGRKKES